MSHMILFCISETCSAPTDVEYRKVYSDWCHEFEKYKMAMKTWQNKQQVKVEVSFFSVI